MQTRKANTNAIVQDFRNKGVFESKDSILSRINLSTDETEKDGDFDSLPFLNKKNKNYDSYNIPHLEQSIRKNRAKEFDFDFKNEQQVNTETERMELALERKHKEQKFEQWADNIAQNSEGAVLSQRQRYWITMFSCVLVSAFIFGNLATSSNLSNPHSLNDIAAVSINNVPAKTQEQQAQEIHDAMENGFEKAKADIETNKKVDDVAQVIKKSGSYDRATQEKINAHLLSIMDINAQLGQGVVDNLTAAKNLIAKGAAK